MFQEKEKSQQTPTEAEGPLHLPTQIAATHYEPINAVITEGSTPTQIANQSPQTHYLTQLQAMANGANGATNASGAIDIQKSAPILQRKPSDTNLPDQLRSGIESLSGISMEGVKVHYNSPKPAALQAHAYAQGTEIHIAPGQERHLPHEAWHVVQQAQGRVKPTLQLKGIAINDDDALEREADQMGAKAIAEGTKTPVQRIAITPHHRHPKGPIQRVTVQEHFAAGKKVVVAGEIHGEIPVAEEQKYWQAQHPPKGVEYEDGSLLVQTDEGTAKVTPDDHYAKILLNLNILINAYRLLARDRTAADETLVNDAADFMEGPDYHRPVDNISSILTSVGIIKDKATNRIYKAKQVETVDLIHPILSEAIEIVDELGNATKNKQDLLAFIPRLTTLEGQLLPHTGVAPNVNLNVARSANMAAVVDLYAARVVDPVVYKIGENHITHMKQMQSVQGLGWAAVDRGQYLADTGLAEDEPEADE